jgi:hypothetical protein
MAFFLAFLVLTTIFVPMIALSQLGRLALSFVFALTLISDEVWSWICNWLPKRLSLNPNAKRCITAG